MRTRVLLLTSWVACGATAPPCPEPEAPPPLACPEGARLSTTRGTSACTTADGTRHGPWRRVDDAGAAVGWGRYRDGRPIGRAWSIGLARAVLTEIDAEGVATSTVCGPDGRVLRITSPELDAEWTEAGIPVRITDKDGVGVTRLREWDSTGVLRYDVPRDGWARDGLGQRVRMVGGWPVGALDADRPDDSRLELTHTIREAHLVEPRDRPWIPPGFSGQRIQHSQPLRLCDGSPPGLACEGRVALWEQGALVLEGSYVDGAREGTWRERRRGSLPWKITRWHEGREVWWSREDGRTRRAEVTVWADDTRLGAEPETWFGAEQLVPVTETRPDGVHEGTAAIDTRDGRHRLGVWTVRDPSTGAVRASRTWVRGRPDDGIVTLTDDMPLPATPLDPDTLTRFADQVAAADPDDGVLRTCWHHRGSVWRDTASTAPGLDPPWTPVVWGMVELMRRGDDTPGAHACLGHLDEVAAAGPAWADTALELRAVLGTDVPKDLAVLRELGTPRAAPPGWTAQVGSGLDDPQWRPWLAGWSGRLRVDDEDVDLPRVRRLTLDGQTLWLHTAPRHVDGDEVVRTGAVLVADRGAYGAAVHLPHGRILSLEVVDESRVRVQWETDAGTRTEVLVLARDLDPAPDCTSAPSDGFAWALAPEDLTAPPMCDGSDLQ